jgi:hypothetical protein
MTLTVSNGVFSQTGQQIYQEPNTAWQIVAVSDLDGDRKSDIVWRNSVTGSVRDADERTVITAASSICSEPNLAGRSSRSGTTTATARQTCCGETTTGRCT